MTIRILLRKSLGMAHRFFKGLNYISSVIITFIHIQFLSPLSSLFSLKFGDSTVTMIRINPGVYLDNGNGSNHSYPGCSLSFNYKH